MDITIRVAEGTDSQPTLIWDSVWNPTLGYADWVVSPLADHNNPGGLQALHALHTAVTLCVFTWRRAEDYDKLPSGSDQKGWWGDAIDIQGYERKIGSRLWLLLRAPLTADTADQAKTYIAEALQVLIDQEAVASIDVTTEAVPAKGMLTFTVKLYSQDGSKVYDQKYDLLWRQTVENV